MENKSRHGCVTAWLIFMIVVNSIVSLMYLLSNFFNIMDIGGRSPLMVLLLALLGISNVIFSILLLKWKKIGFFGFIGTSIITFIINITIGLQIFQAVAGLIGIAILFGILQIKQEGVSAWDNLE